MGALMYHFENFSSCKSTNLSWEDTCPHASSKLRPCLQRKVRHTTTLMSLLNILYHSAQFLSVFLGSLTVLKWEIWKNMCLIILSFTNLLDSPIDVFTLSSSLTPLLKTPTNTPLFIHSSFLSPSF